MTSETGDGNDVDNVNDNDDGNHDDDHETMMTAMIMKTTKIVTMTGVMIPKTVATMLIMTMSQIMMMRMMK